jgi:hypothetical protein
VPVKRTALIVLVVLGACGSGGGSAGGSSSSSLRDANAVLQSSAASATDHVTRLQYGQQAELKGVIVRIDSASLTKQFTSGTHDYQELTLQVRFENHNSSDVEGPLITAHCLNQDIFTNQHSGPIDPLAKLPAQSQAEGPAVVDVQLPCESGWLAWKPRFTASDETEFRWPYPTS